jgi:SP family sugar:H+ symporter-like MFS transporter
MVAAVSPGPTDGLNSYKDIFSKEYRRAIIFCALVTLAPIAYGYDGTYFTALLETPVFRELSFPHRAVDEYTVLVHKI